MGRKIIGETVRKTRGVRMEDKEHEEIVRIFGSFRGLIDAIMGVCREKLDSGTISNFHSDELCNEAISHHASDSGDGKGRGSGVEESEGSILHFPV